MLVPTKRNNNRIGFIDGATFLRPLTTKKTGLLPRREGGRVVEVRRRGRGGVEKRSGGERVEIITIFNSRNKRGTK